MKYNLLDPDERVVENVLFDKDGKFQLDWFPVRKDTVKLVLHYHTNQVISTLSDYKGRFLNDSFAGRITYSNGKCQLNNLENLQVKYITATYFFDSRHKPKKTFKMKLTSSPVRGKSVVREIP